MNSAVLGPGTKMRQMASIGFTARVAFMCLIFPFSFVEQTAAQNQFGTSKEIISRCKNVFTKPPAHTPSQVAVDGPLLGNGYCAAVLAGNPDSLCFYLARNDFWRLKSGYNESFPAVLGKLQISIPALQHGTYYVEQHLYDAITVGEFTKGDTAVSLQSWMADTHDWLVIEMVNKGKANIKASIMLQPPQSDQFAFHPPLENKFADTIITGNNGKGLQYMQRGFEKDVDIKSYAAVACRILGKNSNDFMIVPGEKITILCAFASSFKNTDCLGTAKQQAEKAGVQSIAKARNDHEKWWQRFWNESWVRIGDSVIENQYYKSQYTMASCSRDPKFPPGIFGSWVTQEMPAWNGDYHLNYNYSAPFYGLYSSNHLQQAQPYEAPVLDFMLRGKYYSQKITNISDGVLYPVGIGPLGIETTRKNDLMLKYRSGYITSGEVEDEGLFFGQKSNAAYCATNLSTAFYRTWSQAFAQRVYPFIKSIAIFWQHYLKYENGRYIIENDAIHEGTIGTKNPILSLGLVPMVFQTAIDMSALLGMDKDLRSIWKEKMDHMASYSTQVRNGKTVFKYSEKGTDWWADNTLGIQHIYPAGRIGLASDTALLQIARNTIEVMQRWKDFNGSNSFFPASVRVGYNADTILARLREYCHHTYPNGFQLNNPHGIENCSTVPNTINEMLCMSNQNVLRVFGVWPKAQDASFANIRCEGAFLVSSVLKNGSVDYVKIVSEKGRKCLLQNPWEMHRVKVSSNKKGERFLVGGQIALNTLPGEKLLFEKSVKQ